MTKLSDITYKKFINSFDINDYEVETDDGFVEIKAIHETIPYVVYYIKTNDNLELKCADKHIIFEKNFKEKYVESLKIGDEIITINGISKIEKIDKLDYEENMYDLELDVNSNHRYYTNGILSHNTLLAKTIAREIYGDENALIRLDMSEYSEKNSVSKLYGTSVGYIGYDDGGVLTNAIKNKPYSVVLLDEIEKADESIYNLFLQVFDEGRLTEGNGNLIDCHNCIFIMTSNIGAKKAAEFGNGVGFSNDEVSNKKTIIQKEIKKKFTPEFLNRINKIVYFNSLNNDNLKNIVKLEINKFNNKLNNIKYNILYTDDVVDYIHVEAIKQKEYGARPIIRLIQDNIEDKVTELMLENEYEPNYTFSASCQNGEIVVS